MNFAPITTDDIAALAALQPEGWDDIRTHYQYYLRQPYCDAFKLTQGGHLLGVGAIIKHHNSAWLAQIIVHPEHRSKGLGTKITQALMDHVDRNSIPAISLVATSLGEPIYQKLGFRKTAEYLLLSREDKKPFMLKGNITSCSATDYASVLRLDKLASGEDRTLYLKEHLSSAKLYSTEGIIRGFYLPHLHNAPVIAFDAEAGLELLKYRLNNSNLPTVIPSENKEAIDFLLQNNFQVINRASRMSLGQPVNFKPEMVFNRVSGSLG